MNQRGCQGGVVLDPFRVHGPPWMMGPRRPRRPRSTYSISPRHTDKPAPPLPSLFDEQKQLNVYDKLVAGAATRNRIASP